MKAKQKRASSRRGGMSDHFWNLIGGAMVSAMIAGVFYVLVATVAQVVNENESYWDLFYLKCYFAAILFVYLVMPTMLANLVGLLFGSKSKASGNKKLSTRH